MVTTHIQDLGRALRHLPFALRSFRSPSNQKAALPLSSLSAKRSSIVLYASPHGRDKTGRVHGAAAKASTSRRTVVDEKLLAILEADEQEPAGAFCTFVFVGFAFVVSAFSAGLVWWIIK